MRNAKGRKMNVLKSLVGVTRMGMKWCAEELELKERWQVNAWKYESSGKLPVTRLSIISWCCPVLSAFRAESGERQMKNVDLDSVV